MIYICCEKPSLAKNLQDAFNLEKMPDISCFSAITHFFWSSDNKYGPYWINIPKNLSFQDIPYNKKPELILKDKYYCIIYNKNIKEKPDYLNLHLQNNEFVFLDDNKGTNQIMVFMQFIKNMGLPTKTSMMTLNDLTHHGIIKSFNERKPLQLSDTNYGLVYTNLIFDSMFFINSLVLFEKFKFKDSFKLSKEHLFLLYQIKYFNNVYYKQKLDNVIDKTLVDIYGTGKYPPCALPIVYNYQYYNNIPQKQAFLNEIIHELVDINLVMINHSNQVTLTEKGKLFINSLHPDCYDPDIFGRLISWSHLPISEIDIKIKNYIKRYFGKQKRFIYHRVKPSYS